VHINIRLEKENISTCLWGDGVAIFAQDDFWITLSWEAVKELLSDINRLEKQIQEKEEKSGNA
jgi:hypothetical protein